MLNILTFTGVDERTDLGKVLSIAEFYPRVEFGVLVGSQTGMVPRFPPLPLVEKCKSLQQQGRGSWSVHICGTYARAVMGIEAARGPTQDFVRSLCSGFNRVQINLHGDFFDESRIAVSHQSVKEFAESVECETTILQHRSGWDAVPLLHPQVEYLFDLSEGRGIESFQSWPDPPARGAMPGFGRVGYAGGIGPDNIEQAMERIRGFNRPDAQLWLDMEGRIRTDGWFDMEKVKAVCDLVFEPL